MNQLDQAIAERYEVFTEGNTTTYVVKTHDDHPYQLTYCNGLFTLRQAYQARVYTPLSWRKVVSGKDRDVVLQHLARRHNAASKYMPGWKIITL